MNRDIFSVGLSVEAVSAYILIDDLTASGSQKAAMDRVRDMWNASPDQLGLALAELERRGIIKAETDSLSLKPDSDWIS